MSTSPQGRQRVGQPPPLEAGRDPVGDFVGPDVRLAAELLGAWRLYWVVAPADRVGDAVLDIVADDIGVLRGRSPEIDDPAGEQSGRERDPGQPQPAPDRQFPRRQVMAWAIGNDHSIPGQDIPLGDRPIRLEPGRHVFLAVGAIDPVLVGDQAADSVHHPEAGKVGLIVDGSRDHERREFLPGLVVLPGDRPDAQDDGMSRR